MSATSLEKGEKGPEKTGSARSGVSSAAFAGFTLEEFADALASRKPVPGGGGAAALCGALAAALAGMVINISREEGASGAGTTPEEALSEAVIASHEGAEAYAPFGEAHRLQGELLALVEKDAEAFAALMEAYRLPRGSECEGEERARLIELRTKAAAETPLEMMKRCGEVIELLFSLAETGKRSVLSDVGCGAALAAAGMRAAMLNVTVNTGTLPSAPRAREIEDEGRGMLERYIPMAERIYDEVEAAISRGSSRGAEASGNDSDTRRGGGARV